MYLPELPGLKWRIFLLERMREGVYHTSQRRARRESKTCLRRWRAGRRSRSTRQILTSQLPRKRYEAGTGSSWHLQGNRCRPPKGASPLSIRNAKKKKINLCSTRLTRGRTGSDRTKIEAICQSRSDNPIYSIAENPSALYLKINTHAHHHHPSTRSPMSIVTCFWLFRHAVGLDPSEPPFLATPCRSAFSHMRIVHFHLISQCHSACPPSPSLFHLVGSYLIIAKLF